MYELSSRGFHWRGMGVAVGSHSGETATMKGVTPSS
jgi:hypothetical protein